MSFFMHTTLKEILSTKLTSIRRASRRSKLPCSIVLNIYKFDKKYKIIKIIDKYSHKSKINIRIL
jgi:selenocysteine-specific translation elongation factor